MIMESLSRLPSTSKTSTRYPEFFYGVLISYPCVVQDSVVIIDGLTKVRYRHYTESMKIILIAINRHRTGGYPVGVSAGSLGLKIWSRLFLKLARSLMEVPITRKSGIVSRSYYRYWDTARMQLAAIPLLDPAHVAMEKVALQKHFKMKRDHILARLHALHLDVDIPPTSTFYIWLNLEKLPPPLNNGLVSLCSRLHDLIYIPCRHSLKSCSKKRRL